MPVGNGRSRGARGKRTAQAKTSSTPEFAVHFGDFRIQSGFVGNAMQTLDLGMFTLVIGRREARTRLEHTHLRRVFEPFRQQRDDGGVDVVYRLAQRGDFRCARR